MGRVGKAKKKIVKKMWGIFDSRGLIIMESQEKKYNALIYANKKGAEHEKTMNEFIRPVEVSYYV